MQFTSGISSDAPVDVYVSAEDNDKLKEFPNVYTAANTLA
jgi:hypothetical protein